MKLRPRLQQPPSDHSYSHIPGLPHYDLSSGPKVMMGPGLPIYRQPRAESTEPSEHSPRKRKWYYGQRKRKRRLRIVTGEGENATAEGESGSIEVAEGKKKKRCTSESSNPGQPQPGPSSAVTNDQGHNPGKTSRRHGACGSCRKRWHHRVFEDEFYTPSRQSQRLVRKNYKLPFEGLPYTAKMHIFSMLSACDRGRAAGVCKEWSELLRSPRIWAHVDFGIFNPPVRRLRHGINSRPFFMEWFSNFTEYNAYIARIAQYISFLTNVKPCLRSFQCAFNLLANATPSSMGTPGETWLRHIMKLLESAQCHELSQATIDWTQTPVRPPCAEKYCCLFNKARMKFQSHYKRIKQFHILFNHLTQHAVNINKLTLPFDWSPRSVLLLCRLRRLRQLTLQRYLGLCPLQQSSLNTVLRALPELTHLTLDVCLGSSANRYNMEHSRLVSLDLGASQGFQIHRLKLPCLQTLVLPRRCLRPGGSLPCLYGLLREGCPQLTCLNKLRLQPFWLDYCYPELDMVLKHHCPCDAHMQQIAPQHQ